VKISNITKPNIIFHSQYPIVTRRQENEYLGSGDMEIQSGTATCQPVPGQRLYKRSLSYTTANKAKVEEWSSLHRPSDVLYHK
jgi:hypothetical protein